MPRTVLNNRRSRTSCSLIALATVLVVGASPASAQSLLGTGTYVTNPVAGGITTAPNTTNIALNGGNTIIHWTPTDNAVGTGTNIVFQNAGTTANFNGAADFAVLNRVMVNDATRAIVMNGTVNAQVGGAQHGSVYFYSPSGFIFGGSSVFNVGSLVVTTLPITDAAFSALGAGGFGQVEFGQALNANSAIVMNGTVNANIQVFGIPAPTNSSYVAMIAPQVVHSGTINVNGSAALVAAEAATINFSPDGLFDIQVTVGSTSSSGVEVYGDITGPTPTGTVDKQAIYLVAVPKNDAMTMVIGNGADLGFTLANSAVDDNGVIVLSAGHDIVDGQIGARSAGHGANATGNFSFTGAHATNNLIGEATGTAQIFSTGGQPTTVFDNDVSVHALGGITLSTTGAGSSLSIGGNLTLSTDIFGSGSQSVLASDISMSANAGSTISVAQGTTLSANATGGSVSSGTGGNGTGGFISVNAESASMSLGPLTINAQGTGGSGTEPGANAGQGTGGLVWLHSDTNGAVTITGAVNINTLGTGGDSWAGDGGFGSGGMIDIHADGGLLSIGSLYAQANGDGGYADSGWTSGAGQGGSISIQALAGGSLSVANGLSAYADGTGGETPWLGVNGGDGNGGLVRVAASGTNSTLSVGSYAYLSATGEAGYAGECYVCGGLGGQGIGGEIYVSASGTGATLSFASVDANANGYGGQGVDADGGYGEGGFVQFSASDDGTLNVSDYLYGSANGFGGDQTEGGYGSDGDRLAGDGVGGTVEILTFGSGNPKIDINGWVNIEADGFGGDVYSSFFVFDQGFGAFAESPFAETASAEGEVRGGDGTGGSASAIALAGTIEIDGSLYFSAYGMGGDAEAGQGGDGFGNYAGLFVNGGDIIVGGSAYLDASGHGGNGIGGGDGDGGGDPEEFGAVGAEIFASAGEIDIAGTADLNASGFGGDGAAGGAGGIGTGGVAILESWGVQPAAIYANLVVMSADGHGGDGGAGLDANDGGNGGNGGIGVGGQIGLNGSAAGGILDVGASTLSAQAFGGDGGDGGNGDSGSGGNGGAGGSATAGRIQVGTVSHDLSIATGGGATFTTVLADASALGGNGGDGGTGGGGDGAGGDGGAATGGLSMFLVRGVLVTADTVQLAANATGGNGGNGETQGNGGDATTGAVLVESKDRFNQPTQRGTLVANAITGDAVAAGGLGAINGTSVTTGGSYFRVLNGDANIGSVNFQIAGDLYDGTSGPDYIQAQDGTATIGSFAFDTTGELAVYTTSTGTLNVGTLTLTAGNFIDHPTLVGPINPGTIFAGNVIISTGGDFVADANWDVTNTFVVDAPGLIRLDNVYDDNGIDFSAGGSIDIDSIDAGTFVDLDAGGSISIFGPLTAGGYVSASAGTDLNFTTIDAGSSVDLGAGNDITGTSIMAGGSIWLYADAGNISLGSATSSFASITMEAGNDIDLSGDLLADGDILLTAAGLIDMKNATGGFFRADALGGTFTADNITSDADIRIFADDDVTAGDLSAGLPVESSKALRIDTNGSVVVGNMVSLGGIDVTADGSVSGLNVTTGDVLITEANGAITYGNISAGLVNPQPATEPASVVLDSATSITVGNIDAAGTVGFLSTGSLTAGNVTTGADLLGLVNGNIAIGDITADGRVLLADSSMFTDAGGAIGNFGDDEVDIESIFAATPVATNGSITIGDVDAGSFTAAAGTSLTTGLIDTDSEMVLDAGGAISTGNLFAGAFVLANGGSITTGNIDADSVEMASTGGNIATGDISAFGDVELDAFGDIFAGDIAAGSIDLAAGDDIMTGDLTTLFIFESTQEGGGGPQKLYPGASITLEAGGDIATGDIDSIDGVYADAGGSLSTGTIDAVDFVDINSGGNMTTGNIDAGSDLFADAGGTMTLGALSGFDIELESGGNMTFVSANADTEFDFSSGGSVNGGNVTAGNGIYGDAAGTVTLANLTVSGPPQGDDDFSIGIGAAGNITVGNVSGFAPVGFATLGNLTTGNVTAGDLFLAMAAGSISINGSITTSGEGGGRVYMADDSMFFTGGGTIDGDGDFDPSIVLALDPVATGGSIAINGPVNTGQFDAAAGTSLTTQAITASGDIHARAGGTATLNGIWNSGGEVNLVSNDIDITGTGGIAANGDVALVSTNATQALIGDGLAGTGYALSNAEFGRLEGSSVYILARGDASAAQDMLIGNLTVTGPSAGSTIESPEGILVFGVGDFQSETVSGVIRVNGNVAATGFGSSNAIEFYADRFELDAATGSVSILSSGSTLGGELGIYANRIHVAAGSILDQLAVNPTYTNYQQDLNQPAAVQRPEGVLRADTLWIESDNLQSVLIQNTGSDSTPAGFLVRQAFINDDDEVAGPPGSINLVVNGQVVTEGGTLTGIAARDALVTPETNITPFTANSTINGCPLTGPCTIKPPAPPPTTNLVENQIDLIGNPIGDNEFDDNQEGDEGASNPIAPPQPLFDTRPLVPSGDVNDPVSGTGNPALTGSEAQCEDEEDGQCAAPVDGGSQ